MKKAEIKQEIQLNIKELEITIEGWESVPENRLQIIEISKARGELKAYKHMLQLFD
ncbi:MAG: hypothetical protein IJ709_10755 [Selenomonas sp.]|nr:hypothetical protein [Selenomonas sp.]